jgi:hypothetical protein
MIEKLKIWVKGKLWPWFKKNWLSLGTVVVLLIVYGVVPEESGLGILVGLWLFVIGAVLLWRLFKKESA